MSNQPDPGEKRAPVENPHEPGEEWDEVDEASDESFPASDPPGNSGGHAHENELHDEKV